MMLSWSCITMYVESYVVIFQCQHCQWSITASYLCVFHSSKNIIYQMFWKNNRSNKLVIKTTSIESTQHAYPCSLLRYWINTWLGNLIKVDEYWFRMETPRVTENPEVIHLLEHFLNLENLTGLRNQLKFTHDQLVDSDWNSGHAWSRT